MADKDAEKKDGQGERKGTAQGPSRTRLVKDFRPFSKEQQVGKRPSPAPKGGRR